MISDYNNVIVDKLMGFIEAMVERINMASEVGSIKVDRYEMANDPDLDINYLISHQMTSEYTVKVHFKIENNGKVSTTSDDISVPKMVNNVFIIEGKMRVPTNTLNNDNRVTIYSENIRINDNINIMYDEDVHEPGGYKLTVNYYDEAWTPVVLDFNEENFKKYHEYFRLGPDEIDKLKIKLDTDDIGEYLTRDMVLKLISLGHDKIYDRMVDKKIFSPEANFMHYLWSSEVRRKILSSMRSKFYQYGGIYLRDIQNAITRYFKLANESTVDIPSNVNPLVFDSLRNKIKISRYTAYNNSMADIVDVVNTPINGNINQLNEINVCVEIKDDDIYIKCYEYPSGKPVTVKYLRYCTKKVIFNDDWDYDNNTFLTPKKVRYKLRCKDRVGTSADKYDYIEPKADDKLSIASRRIPLGNKSDSVRMHMGTGMQKQALEIANSQPPLITPGYDDIDYETSTLLTRYKGKPGVVTKIEDNKIFIKSDHNGSIQFYEVPTPTKAQHDSIISFIANVKVGSKVKSGDVIIKPYVLRRKSYELGVNASAVYLSYLGMTFEDGQVISQSLANRFMHYSLLDVYMPIYPDDIITYIRPIGSKIKLKDVLANCKTRIKVSSSIKDVFTNTGNNSGILSGMGIDYNQSNAVVPNSFEDGFLLDTKIHLEPGRDLTNKETVAVLKNYPKMSKADTYNEIPKRFHDVKASDMEMNDRIAGYISFKLLRLDVAKIGDKICNRYGGKGVISLIVPDDLMPRIERDGKQYPVEIVLNPGSVLKRKNISQIYEVNLTKVIQAVYQLVKPLIEEGKIDKARAILKRYYGNQFDEYSDEKLITECREKGILAFQMKTGFFAKVTADQILNWMKELGIKDTDKIFLPDVVTAETSNGLKVFPLKNYQPQPDHRNIRKYELGYCEAEALTGDIYMMKLYHQSNYTAKVTSTVIETDEPIMGRGNYRDADGGGGQKIGEMELWTLMSSKLEKFVQSQAVDMVDSQYAFLNEMLLAGYTISDPDGNPYLSNQRSRNKALEKLGK